MNEENKNQSWIIEGARRRRVIYLQVWIYRWLTEPSRVYDLTEVWWHCSGPSGTSYPGRRVYGVPEVVVSWEESSGPCTGGWWEIVCTVISVLGV